MSLIHIHYVIACKRQKSKKHKHIDDDGEDDDGRLKSGKAYVLKQENDVEQWRYNCFHLLFSLYISFFVHTLGSYVCVRETNCWTIYTCDIYAKIMPEGATK